MLGGQIPRVNVGKEMVVIDGQDYELEADG
jgi:hypothetical protein